MATLVLAAAFEWGAEALGFAAGSFAVSAAGLLGSTIGGMIDQSLFGPKMQGPRLSDRSVQSSADGAPLPREWGSMRMAGNVIWSSGLKETSHSQSAGIGSGGGGSYTTYTYSTDVAVAICEGSISGIRRIWADTKLICDAGAGTVASLVANTSRAAAIRIYPGNTTQTADPLIQASVGAANCTAYRDTAYIVFEDLQLADFGNRLPNFTFEVVKAGSETDYLKVSQTLDTISWSSSERIMSVDGVIRTVQTGSQVAKIYDMSNGALLGVGLRAGVETRAQEETTTGIRTVGVFNGFRIIVDNSNAPHGHLYQCSPFDAASPSTYTKLRDITAELLGGSLTFSCAPCVDGVHLLVFPTNGATESTAPTDGSYGLGRWVLLDLVGYQVVSQGSVKDYQMNGSGGRYSNYCTAYAQGAWVLESDLLHVWGAYGAGTFNPYPYLYEIDATSGDMSAISYTTGTVHPAWATYTADGFNAPTLWADNGMCWIMSGLSSQPTGKSFMVVYSRAAGQIALASQTLDTVAGQILASADLQAGQYDVSVLAGKNVRGYTVPRPMSARAALEPLMAAYLFDLVEQDGKIVAVLRGGTVDATLTNDDLGAMDTPDGSTVNSTRMNELELPSEVQLSYSNQATDYQVATCYQRRLTAKHTNKSQIQFPMVLTGQEAARLAQSILDQAWYSSRYQHAFQTTMKNAALLPTDIVALPNGQQARLSDVTMGGGIVQCNAVPDLPALYVGTAVGADAFNLSQVLGFVGPTKYALLDCVMLRDQDNSAGMYLAECGYIAGWPGGALYKSSDGGSTYTLAAAVGKSQAAQIGYAVNALGAGDCFTWDKANALTVNLLSGSLASATELSVLAGANVGLLGAQGRWELIQWKTAVLNANGSYTLTDLLRGRKGTEFAASQHAVYDIFVVLTSATERWLALANTEINATRLYKAVTSGKAIETVAADSLTYTGESLRCLAPVLLGAGRNAGFDVVMQWTRRDRVNAAWNNYGDVPLSESSEAYEIDIFTNSSFTTVKRTLTGLSTPTATYTSAQQVTDFGSNQATVYVRIYQISSVTGRGHYLQGAV